MGDRYEPTRTFHALAARLTVLLLAATLAACGNVTAGGVDGEVEVYMSGDADGSGSDPVASPSSTEGIDPSAVGGSSLNVIVGSGLEGDVRVTASLYLRSSSGSLTPLTPGTPVIATVDLGGAQEPRVAEEPVPAGSYEGLRVVFTEVVADVTGGLEIGGVPFIGEARVDLDGDSVVVERTLAIDVTDDAPVSLLVDLKSDVWLELLVPLDPVTATVVPADFASAVEVTVRAP